MSERFIKGHPYLTIELAVSNDTKICRNLKQRLSDAQTYYHQLVRIGDLEEHVGNVEAQIRLLTYGITQSMQIVGEECTKFSEDFVNAYMEGINLDALYKTRNIISHAYEAINLDVVKSIVYKYFPDIEYAIEQFAIDLQQDNPYKRKRWD